MATVFMRWLERRPAAYDRGIRLLTLGRLDQLHAAIEEHLQGHPRVLEIGCGTGNLTLRLAANAGAVEAIDLSADMLEAAREKLAHGGLLDRVTFTRMDALTLDTHFEAQTFDLIVSSLAFSELSIPGQDYVLRHCHQLLKPNGSLLLLDECQPSFLLARVGGALVRGPLRFITWLLTRTTTHPFRDIEQKLSRNGFESQFLQQRLGGALCLFKATPLASFSPETMSSQIPSLRHRVTLWTRLQDLWALFFRVLPPYPAHTPGLYAIGSPDPESPVFVTGNYDLTIRRLLAVIDGQIDAWLLIVDSSGINVWCGAGGGFLDAERVIGALNMSGIQTWHRNKHLVLPQLCANGVDGNLIREQTGWRVSWGPVRAVDIHDYLAGGFQKTDQMRTIDFPWKERLEMVSATLGLYSLMILIPVAIFWSHLFWSVLIALLGLSYFYALALPLIPGRDGLIKSLPLAVIALTGMLVYSFFVGMTDPEQLFRQGVGMVALSVFIAAEMQGMSPLMRGEQANWGWEAVIALVLGGLYWLVPRLFGWSA